MLAVDVEKRFRNSIAHLPSVCFAIYCVGKRVLGPVIARVALCFSAIPFNDDIRLHPSDSPSNRKLYRQMRRR